MTPEIRFSEFSGYWKDTKIGAILKIGSGKDYKHLNKGNIPVFGSGGFMRYVDDYLYDGESVCIGRKGTIDSPVFLNGKFWTVDTLFYTHLFNGVIPKHVYSIFQNINWKKYNEAGGVPSLSKSTIESIDVNIAPSDKEQLKIASFLTAVDKKINLLRLKRDCLQTYRRGVMQKIFSQEIRFKKNDGSAFPDWEEKELSEVLEQEVRQIQKPNKNYLAIGIRSHMNGTFQKPDFDPDKIAMDKLFVVKNGDLIVNITFAWEGAIAIVKPEDDGGLVSHRFPTYLFKENLINDYFKYVISDRRFKYTLDLISPGGAGRNRVLSKKDFLKIKWSFPEVDEQQKIANFLSVIDQKINAVNNKITQTETFKKGLLQKMRRLSG